MSNGEHSQGKGNKMGKSATVTATEILLEMSEELREHALMWQSEHKPPFILEDSLVSYAVIRAIKKLQRLHRTWDQFDIDALQPYYDLCSILADVDLESELHDHIRANGL
jgi:hypothetical protein